MAAELDWSKLTGAIGMMGSSSPGEALNARDLAEAMLKRAGLSWSDLKAMVRPPEGVRPADIPRYHGDVSGDAGRLIIELQDRLKAAAANNSMLAKAYQEATWRAQEAETREAASAQQCRQLQAAVTGLQHKVRQHDERVTTIVRLHEADYARQSRILVQLTEENIALRRAAIANEPKRDLPPHDLLLIDQPLSTRAINALDKAGITTVQALAALPPYELVRIENIGNKTYRELRALCIGYGLWPADTPLRPERPDWREAS